MDRTKQLIVAGVAAVVLVSGGVWAISASNSSEEPADNTQAATQHEHSHEHKHEISVSDDGSTVSYQGEAGVTALELLRDSDVEVRTEQSSFGEFVTGIGSVDADASVEYWAFYVNGEYASEGAGTYETMDGETIEWKLEKLEQ